MTRALGASAAALGAATYGAWLLGATDALWPALCAGAAAVAALGLAWAARAGIGGMGSGGTRCPGRRQGMAPDRQRRNHST